MLKLNPFLTAILNYALVALLGALKGGAQQTVVSLESGSAIKVFQVTDASGGHYSFSVQKDS